MTAKTSFRPGGQLWLTRGGDGTLDEARIALLEKIRDTGSITRAGKAVGISYRTAWITVDHLNALSDRPLVERSQGGKSGGGTRLTSEGEELVRMYRAAAAEHGAFLERLRAGVGDFERFQRLARMISLKTSARNQLFGQVETVARRGLEALVSLKLKGGDRVRSRITAGGLESLGLGPGDEAYALIKANWVALGKPGRKPAADGNALAGTIESVRKLGSKAEAAIRLPGGSLLVAMVPAGTAGARAGRKVTAVFRAEDVILGLAR